MRNSPVSGEPLPIYNDWQGEASLSRSSVAWFILCLTTKVFGADGWRLETQQELCVDPSLCATSSGSDMQTPGNVPPHTDTAPHWYPTPTNPPPTDGSFLPHWHARCYVIHTDREWIAAFFQKAEMHKCLHICGLCFISVFELLTSCRGCSWWLHRTSWVQFWHLVIFDFGNVSRLKIQVGTLQMCIVIDLWKRTCVIPSFLRVYADSAFIIPSFLLIW